MKIKLALGIIVFIVAAYLIGALVKNASTLIIGAIIVGLVIGLLRKT